MKSRRLFPVLLAVCALVATAMPRAHAQAITMPGYPAPGAPATITVSSTGAAPKKLLRYTIPSGQKARMEMTMSMEMNMNLAGNPTPMSLPGMKMTIDLAVTNVAPNGDITYDLAFTGLSLDSAAGTDPNMAQIFQGLTAGITSIKGTSTISSRGVTKSTVLDVADPTIKQMLGGMTSTVENLSMPFPEEAVGIGARWEVRQATSAGGQTIFTKSLYEVVSIDGQAVSLKATTEQTAPPQSVSNPSLPAGMEMTLEKMSGAGSGTTTIRLDSLVPTSSMESTTSTAMSMNAGGQSMAVTTDGKIKITVGPAKDR